MTTRSEQAGDTINISRESFQAGIAGYGDRERELLEWFWDYAHRELCGSRSAISSALGYDWTVLFKVFTGRYEASIDRFCESVANIKRRADAGAESFILTPVTKKIAEALDYARDLQSMAYVVGPTGRSKTTTAKWWTYNNAPRARYLRVPSGCSRRSLVNMLCRVCGIGISGKKACELEPRLMTAFDFRNTLVLDEAGHLLPRSAHAASSCAMAFVRDLHDACQCGVAMIFTNIYVEEFRHGRLAGYFEQYVGRTDFNVLIPQEVLRDEVVSVVSAFRKDPTEKLLSLALKLARARDGKLRTLCRDLTRAKEWAGRHNRELGYDDLKLASDWRLSGGIWPTE